jgi:hypothetical protein
MSAAWAILAVPYITAASKKRRIATLHRNSELASIIAC